MMYIYCNNNRLINMKKCDVADIQINNSRIIIDTVFANILSNPISFPVSMSHEIH